MRDDPQLRTIPFAVGGSPLGSRRTHQPVTTPQEPMVFTQLCRTAHALRLCPQLTVGPVNMAKYRAASQQMRAIFEQFTDLIEPLSLDEAYLDVTSSDHCQGSATQIAEAIRAKISAGIGITVSAGVSSNKFIAKVASDWNKPDGHHGGATG